MKLGPVTKLDKRNTSTSKNKTKQKKQKNKQTTIFDVDLILTSCDVIVIFLIYGQFGAIWKLDSRGMVYNTYPIINGNLLSYKTKNKTKISVAHLLHYCFELRHYFYQKC